ncbi:MULTISPECIES: MFS transporter [Roseobacteraceae]|uniref:Putative symporter YjmB n=1 Tax=Pseudosulfitobacter pseudonitzschiae TaxID=1402135 RepID=A0A221K6J2_9RHOB|nr:MULTISPECIES: MFS transporter [Roseobacteraceae]ASM74500.1 putative symporter YjmB [Pseudosulfitobacter pseudonitzschiae]
MKLWQARLAFGSPDFSISLLFATVNGWFLFYLVSIIGIPPLIAGAVFVFGRFLDGLLDPLVGAWTDRHGRKRAIVAALPVTASAFVALWAVPNLFDNSVAQILAIMVTFSVFALAYTFVSVPRLGMLPEFVPEYHGRTGQAGVDMAFVFIAVLISSVAFPTVVAFLSETKALSESQAGVWIGVTVGIATLAVLAYLPFIALIHEPDRQSSQTARPKTIVVLLAFSKTTGAVRTLALFGCSVLALVTLQSILPFWLESGPGITAGGQSVVLLIIFLATLVSLPVWAYLSRLYGKAAGLCIGVCAFLTGIGIAMLLPTGSGLNTQLVLASLIAGTGAGALSMFPWSMIPDIAETHSNRMKTPVQGTTTAAFTMTNKLAAATALFLNSMILQVRADLTWAAEAPEVLLALPAIFAIIACTIVFPMCITGTPTRGA